MCGKVTFRESLKASLEIIQPTLQQMKDFSEVKLPAADLLTPNVE